MDEYIVPRKHLGVIKVITLGPTNESRYRVRQKLPKLYGVLLGFPFTGHDSRYRRPRQRGSPARYITSGDQTWAYALFYWWSVWRLGNERLHQCFRLTPDADLHLAQPPLPLLPGFVGMEHKIGFRAMLRVQFAMQPTPIIATLRH